MCLELDAVHSDLIPLIPCEILKGTHSSLNIDIRVSGSTVWIGMVL